MLVFEVLRAGQRYVFSVIESTKTTNFESCGGPFVSFVQSFLVWRMFTFFRHFRLLYSHTTKKSKPKSKTDDKLRIEPSTIHHKHQAPAVLVDCFKLLEKFRNCHISQLCV